MGFQAEVAAEVGLAAAVAERELAERELAAAEPGLPEGVDMVVELPVDMAELSVVGTAELLADTAEHSAGTAGTAAWPDTVEWLDTVDLGGSAQRSIAARSDPTAIKTDRTVVQSETRCPGPKIRQPVQLVLRMEGLR